MVNHLVINKTSYLTRPESISRLLWDPQISHRIKLLPLVYYLHINIHILLCMVCSVNKWTHIREHKNSFHQQMHSFIKHIKCYNVQLKYLCVCSYMFWSNWTILRELMLSLAKATIMWSWSAKIHRCMICGVVATSISGCGVCTACRVVCN